MNPSIYQIAIFMLSFSRLLACLEQCSVLWVLSQLGLMIFKTLNFRGRVWWCRECLCWHSGRGIHRGGADAGLTEKAVMPEHRGMGFGIRQAK